MENKTTWKDYLDGRDLYELSRLDHARLTFEAEQKIGRKRIRDRGWARLIKARKVPTT